MRALITGYGGFVGPHLAELLIRNDVETWGTLERNQTIKKSECQVVLREMDITVLSNVQEIIEESQPDFIFHLAAQSSVSQSWKEPQATVQVNVVGTINLLESIKIVAPEARTLIVGSGEEYGFADADTGPIHENIILNPQNPYAVSKLAAEQIAKQYYDAYKLPIYIVRSFNHIGPGQGLGFVVADFASQIAKMELGQINPIMRVGNLHAKRDFTDCRDVVRAYWNVINYGKCGRPYNIASGSAIEIMTVLNKLIKLGNIAIEVISDPDLFRPIEVSSISGEITRISNEVGWRPEISLDQSLEDILNYWRRRIEENP